MTDSQQDLSYYEQALALIEQARNYADGVMKSRAEGATLRETVIRDALEQVLTMVHTVAEKVGGQQQIENAVATLEARGAFSVLTADEKALVMQSLDADHRNSIVAGNDKSAAADTSVPDEVPESMQQAVKVAKVMSVHGEVPAKNPDPQLKGDIVVEKVCDKLEKGEKVNAVQVVSRETNEPISDPHKKDTKKAKQKELEAHVKKVDNGEELPSIVLTPTHTPAEVSSDSDTSAEVGPESVVPKGGAPIQLANKTNTAPPTTGTPVTVPTVSESSTFSNIEAKHEIKPVSQPLADTTEHIPKPASMDRQISVESTGSRGSQGSRGSRSPSPHRGLRERVKGIFHKK